MSTVAYSRTVSKPSFIRLVDRYFESLFPVSPLHIVYFAAVLVHGRPSMAFSILVRTFISKVGPCLFTKSMKFIIKKCTDVVIVPKVTWSFFWAEEAFEHSFYWFFWFRNFVCESSLATHLISNISFAFILPVNFSFTPFRSSLYGYRHKFKE